MRLKMKLPFSITLSYKYRLISFIKYSLSVICVSVTLYVMLYELRKSSFDRNECGDYLKMYKQNRFDHSFLLDEPGICFNASGYPRPVFLLVAVTSSVDNFERRRGIRETWGSPKQIMGKNIITVFLLGETKGSPKLQELQNESSTHHDIIQADFRDTYKNLTIKTIVGMKWIHTYCPHASYFMKTDDDMYISYDNILKNLTAPSTPATDFAMGYLFDKNLVIRDFHSKFYVPTCILPEKTYSPYLAGSGYIMSGDLAGRIYRTALSTTFFKLEDAFVGMCLRTLGVKPIGHNGFHFINIAYEYCTYTHDLISSHGVNMKESYRIWNHLQHANVACPQRTVK